MGVLSRVRSFVRHAVYRSDMERAMADELQFHIAQRAEDLAHTRGLAPDEARRIARLEFGAIDKYKEQARQSVGLRLVDELRGDLRFAWRTLRKNKGYAAAALATLAIGIGANTAIFSVIDALILRPLPVERPQELMAVLVQRPGRAPADGQSNVLWEAFRDRQDVFAEVFAWSSPKSLQLTYRGTTHPAQVLIVSGEYFPTLGITPAAGRLLATSDDHRGCTPVAVLSDAFWSEQFGRGADTLGASITLSQQSFEVIGVSRAGFSGVNVGQRFDVAIPLCASALLDKRNLDSGGRQWLSIVGRLDPGIAPEQAEVRLRLLSPDVLAAARPEGGDAEYLKRTFVMAPAGTANSDFRRVLTDPLQVLMMIVALVLVIACANIAGLMLAKGATREKEIAVRAALGASRGRLMRQLLAESVLLSLLGSGLGLLVARWGAASLARSLSTAADPLYLDLAIDGRVLGYTVGVAIAVALLVGLLPASRATRVALSGAMKARSAVGERHAVFHIGKWIVGGQVALSLVLLVAGGLLLRTFVNLVTLDVGFDRANILVVNARPPWFAADATKLQPHQKPLVYDEFARRLGTVPGVVSVARAYTTPIGDDNWVTSLHVDRPGAPSGDDAASHMNFVSPGYFRTLGTPLVAGRDFTDQDTAQSPRVAVVNETLARTFFPGSSPLGARFRTARDRLPIEIVGIVKDSKYESVRQATPATAFIPATQIAPDEIVEEFVLRTAVPPSGLVSPVRHAAADVSKDLVLTFHTMEARIEDDLVQERLIATLAGVFGLAGLLLAMIGLYGVLSYLVAQRRAEFGIRLAIGASRGSLLGLVMKDVAVILAGGLAVGVAVSVPGLTLLERLLYGLEARDAATMGVAACVVSVVVALAGYLPARRATRIDPAVALRTE